MKPRKLLVGIMLIGMSVGLNSDTVQKASVDNIIKYNNQTNTYLNINKDNVITNVHNIQNDLHNNLVYIVEEKELRKEPEWINIKVSYYTNSYSDCGKTDGIGSSNIKLSRGSIAAPKDIPMFSQVYIDGIGNTVVHDRGGSINWIWKDGVKYMKVDVYVPNATRKQLMKMGVVYTKGYLIK